MHGIDQTAALLGLIGGAQAAIGHLEREAIRSTRGSDREPSRLPMPRDKETWDALAAAGVEWLPDETQTDVRKRLGSWRIEKWIRAALPEGWTTRRTDHHLYTDLVDENGRARANMMIHVQDGDAWISIRSRLRTFYTTDRSYLHEQPAVPTIETSDGVVLWRGAPIPARTRDPAVDPEWFKKPSHYDLAYARAAEVLDTAFPGWQDPTALWDETDDALRARLPTSESTAPTGEPYELHVTFYHDSAGRSFCDSGRQAEGLFESDEAAIAALKDARGGGLSYERQDYVITCRGRRVDTWTKRRPEPARPGGRGGLPRMIMSSHGEVYFDDGDGLYSRDPA